jgi:hypothetical protein
MQDIINKEPYPIPTRNPTAHPSPTPTTQPTAHPSPTPTTKPTAHPSQTPTMQPTAHPSPTPTSPTKMPTQRPTPFPTRSCDVHTASCYSSGAFGAVCNGPTTSAKFPVLITKAGSPDQSEDKGVTNSHTEIYPVKSIYLTTGIRVSFEGLILDISGGTDYGSITAIGVQYDNSDEELFTLTQFIFANTSCFDTKWHT